jgi:hypothetical protein
MGRGNRAPPVMALALETQDFGNARYCLRSPPNGSYWRLTERQSQAEKHMSDKFELLDTAGDISGKLRLIYGSGLADPAPFVLTLTPQYVARASGKTPPVSFHEMERYADENAGDLREMAFREKGTGRSNLTLE